MLWERRNITRNAVCRLKPEPRSLDISPQKVCWTQRWGDNTKCFAGKKNVYTANSCKFPMFYARYQHLATQCLSDMFHRFTQSLALDFCSPHGPSVVRVMWNWKFKDRGQPWLPKDSKPGSWNLYLYQIYTNLIQFIQCYFPHHFLGRRRRRDVKTLTRLHLTDLSRQRFSTIPFSTVLYSTSLQNFSTTPFSPSLHHLQHLSTTLFYNSSLQRPSKITSTTLSPTNTATLLSNPFL